METDTSSHPAAPLLRDLVAGKVSLARLTGAGFVNLCSSLFFGLQEGTIQQALVSAFLTFLRKPSSIAWLRGKELSFHEQQALFLAHYLSKSFIPYSPGFLQPDVLEACRRSYERARNEEQPAYNTFRLGLQRLQEPHKFLQRLGEAGLLCWITLPPSRVLLIEGGGGSSAVPDDAGLGAVVAELQELLLHRYGYSVLEISAAEVADMQKGSQFHAMGPRIDALLLKKLEGGH